MAEDGPGLESGEEFAGHRIVGVVGRGGMGVVYRARKMALDRDRALKVIAPALSNDPRFRERFKRESRMAAAIEHPNVIPVHDAGEENGMLYLAMRLVEGGDLHQAVRAEGRLEGERASRIIAGVASALDAAHAAGLVHRDVKPANVLIEPRGGHEHVYLTDFGITRTTTGGDTLTGTGEFVGSVEYIAPEQAAGEAVDARTDVYSLGGVCHFVLTGRPPFPRENQLATLFAHANAPRPRATETDPSLPRAVDEVIVRAMATDPDKRYSSAGELAGALAGALGAPAPTARSATVTAPAGVPTRVADIGETRAAKTRQMESGDRRRRAIPLVLGLAALALVAAVVVIASGGGEEPPPPEEDAGGGGGGSPNGPVAREVATMNVGDSPSGLAAGPLKMFVAARGVGDVQPIDAESNQPEVPVESVPSVASLAVGFDSIWAVSPVENSVMRLNPAQDEPPIPIEVGASPSDIAIDENYVWVANQGDNTVSRIDPATNAVDATEETGESPRSIATGEGSVWTANIDSGTVSEIDAESAKRVGNTIETPGSRPNDLAVGEGRVWVVDNVDGTLTRIDPQSQQVEGEPLDVGTMPRGVKVGLGSVWVANGGDSTIVAVDPESLELVGKPARVGTDPADIAIAFGSVWTANEGESTVTRLDPEGG